MFGMIYYRRKRNRYGMYLFYDREDAINCFEAYGNQGFIFTLSAIKLQNLLGYAMGECHCIGRVEGIKNYDHNDRLTNLKFKYWNCDFGITEDVEIVNTDFVLQF